MIEEAKKQEDNLEPTPYRNAYRKDLDKAEETVTEENTSETSEKDENQNSFLKTEKQTKQQEHDFKKRYDDLKSHYDKKLKEWKQKEAELTEKSTPKYTPPKSVEELESFREQYPDVYNVVESVAHLQADKRVKDIENKLQNLREQEAELTKQNAMKELTVLHPDFTELKDSDEFIGWLNTQPNSISDGIYKNNTDAKWAARVIDLYKADNNLSKKTNKMTDSRAAEAVTKTARSSVDVTNDGKKIWSVDEIAKMRPQEFAKYEKEIDKARKEGRIRN